MGAKNRGARAIISAPAPRFYWQFAFDCDMILSKQNREVLCMGKERGLVDYPTIKAAVAGEVWAIEKVVAHYADYIEEACTVEAKGPDGSVRKYVDEDMKQIKAYYKGFCGKYPEKFSTE